MSDFPSEQQTPTHISTWMAPYSQAAALARPVANISMAGASLAYVANLALYLPFEIPFPYPVRRMFWVNGSSASSNTDVGIYTLGGVRLYSTGSTVQSGASTIQYAGTPDLVLTPGAYFLAFASDGTTNRAYGSSTWTNVGGRMSGIMQQTSAFPLPATATFAQYAQTILPLFGITRTTAGV